MTTPGFRSFSPPLQRFFVATVINMVGSAALFGFVLIYFHEVRGISLGRAGLAVGAMSFTMVVLTPVAGYLCDRFGARRTLAAGCVTSIIAGALYAVVATFPAALAVSMLLGVGNALWFPSQSALLTLIVAPEERPAVSAFARASLNLGAALGGVLGGFLVRADSLGRLPLAVRRQRADVPRLPRHPPRHAVGQGRPQRGRSRRLPPGSGRRVLRPPARDRHRHRPRLRVPLLVHARLRLEPGHRQGDDRRAVHVRRGERGASPRSRRCAGCADAPG